MSYTSRQNTKSGFCEFFAFWQKLHQNIHNLPSDKSFDIHKAGFFTYKLDPLYALCNKITIDLILMALESSSEYKNLNNSRGSPSITQFSVIISFINANISTFRLQLSNIIHPYHHFLRIHVY